MQHRYVGDIGDYVKFGLLRKLSAGRRIGIAWYLYPDEKHNNDGFHTQYLSVGEKWEERDPDLFRMLKLIVNDQRRSVDSVESSGILAHATYATEILQCDVRTKLGREEWRAAWFQRVAAQLSGCDIIFADPDNGLCLEDDFVSSRQAYWKRLPLQEVLGLSKGRTGIFYHHNSRYAGGHSEEISYWLKLLPLGSAAIYWGGKGSRSPRTFFVVNPTREIQKSLHSFCNDWSPQAQLYER